MVINKLSADKSNFREGRNKKIEFLVIHYTANDGDSALSNCKYFKGKNRNSSAHYFVDENGVYQSVEDKDTSWHCGTKGTYYHTKCRNENSIGIELCSKKDKYNKFYFEKKTLENAIYLINLLLKKYNISKQNILRHYDITHKNCPLPFVEDYNAWKDFKNEIGDKIYMKVKRIVEIDGVKKEFEAINFEDKNYYSIRDIANLFGKSISYDNKTKITTIL